MSINIQLHQEDPTTVDFVPVANVSAGDIVQYDDEGHVGFSTYDIPAGKLGALRIGVILRGLVKNAVSIAVGERVYYNATNKYFTKDTSDLFVGYRVPWKQSAPGNTAWIAVKMVSQGTGNSPETAVAENVAALTDSTGGTPSEAGAVVAPASTDYTAAELKANFATIVANQNAVIAALKGAGLMEEDAETSDVSA